MPGLKGITTMPYNVTLQIPIQTYDGNVWMFRRQMTLNMPPFVGMLVSGRGLPAILPREEGWETQVINIGEDLDTGMIFVNLLGGREDTYTKEEMQSRMGPGWYLYDQPLYTPEMAGADAEELNENNPGDPSG